MLDATTDRNIAKPLLTSTSRPRSRMEQDSERALAGGFGKRKKKVLLFPELLDPYDTDAALAASKVRFLLSLSTLLAMATLHLPSHVIGSAAHRKACSALNAFANMGLVCGMPLLTWRLFVWLAGGVDLHALWRVHSCQASLTCCVVVWGGMHVPANRWASSTSTPVASGQSSRPGTTTNTSRSMDRTVTSSLRA